MFYQLILVAGFVAAASAGDLIVGVEGGSKVFDQNITASPAIWQQVNNLTVTANDSEVISHILVIDNRPEKDGQARIVEGGEGQKNVTIELKSPAVFRGYDFSVVVFTAPDNGNVNVPSSIPEQSSQVPLSKDLNVNNNHEVENNGDVVTAQNPTVSSTEVPIVNDNNQDKVEQPAVVAQEANGEQIRQNRDTKEQEKEKPAVFPSPVHVHIADAGDKKSTEQPEHDKASEAESTTVADKTTPKKSEDIPAEGPVVPVAPQEPGKVEEPKEQPRNARETEGEAKIVPGVENGEKKEDTTKPDASTTVKNIAGEEHSGTTAVPVNSSEEKSSEEELNEKKSSEEKSSEEVTTEKTEEPKGLNVPALPPQPQPTPYVPEPHLKAPLPYAHQATQ